MKIFRHLLFTGSLLACLYSVNAQNYTTYSGYKDDMEMLNRLEKHVNQKHLDDSLKATGKHKKDYYRAYREIKGLWKYHITHKAIVTSAQANKYLTSIVDEIIEKNPVLQNLSPRPVAVIVREGDFNAYTNGNRVVAIHLGLISKIENESQLAFIVCHELAHNYLEHTAKSVNEEVRRLNDEELKKELKKIAKSEYEQWKKWKELNKELVFSERRHSRLHETETDSMAMRFFANTSFNANAALTQLAMMDTINESYLDMEKIIRKNFSFSEYPFKESWIKKESAFFGGPRKMDEKLADSLKTHPDCKLRIKLLEPTVKALSTDKKLFPINESLFRQIQDTLKYELIEFYWDKQWVSRALFHALELHETRPGDPYLISTIGACLNKMYVHQKAHTLNTVVNLPSPYREKDYNTLLTFLGKLRLEEIASLSHYYLASNAAKGKGIERFEKALNESKNYIK